MLLYHIRFVRRRTVWKSLSIKELNTIKSVSKDTLRNDIS